MSFLMFKVLMGHTERREWNKIEFLKTFDLKGNK